MSTFVAASTQQTIGVFLAGALVVGWIVYIVANIKRRGADVPAVGAEIELAPNRKRYFEDDELEGPRLERYLGWSLVLLVISSVGLPIYWLNEPSRQAGATEEFDREAVERGRLLFLPTESPEHGAHFGCATCHGAKGEGSIVPNYTVTDYLGRNRVVTWSAPSLDTVMLRHSPEEVRRIIVFGRKNTPMPAWGSEGGGPLNDQQVDDLVAYIGSLTISTEEARERVRTETIEEARTLGKTGSDDTIANDGEALFNSQCARCHTMGWSIGEPHTPGGGAFGFNLTNGLTLRQFPASDDHVEFITTGSDFEQPYGLRGVGSGRMPGFGLMLTPDQIQAIVEYERSL